jgi:osmotically-inducible protein OsmY
MQRPIQGNATLAACALACFLCAGCDNGDSERLARVWTRVGSHLRALSGGARERLSRGLRSLPGDETLRGHVASRLNLDRALATSTIEVQASGTTVTLKGEIPDPALRQRALDLAKETVGVEQVNDELGPKE